MRTTLVDQPTAAPTRKLTAVLVAGAIVATVQTLITTYAPDTIIDPAMMAQMNQWVQLIIVGIAGYFTRERL